ncbi:MAG: hypothetical protein GY769_01785 [bacterium]|nr:hypothetical protein [bacterium]
MAKKLFRCKVENSTTCQALEFNRAFGPGAIVDLGESIGRIGNKKYKLADLVRSLDYFEEIKIKELGQELAGAIPLEGENGEGD